MWSAAGIEPPNTHHLLSCSNKGRAKMLLYVWIIPVSFFYEKQNFCAYFFSLMNKWDEVITKWPLMIRKFNRTDVVWGKQLSCGSCVCLTHQEMRLLFGFMQVPTCCPMLTFPRRHTTEMNPPMPPPRTRGNNRGDVLMITWLNRKHQTKPKRPKRYMH